MRASIYQFLIVCKGKNKKLRNLLPLYRLLVQSLPSGGAKQMHAVWVGGNVESIAHRIAAAGINQDAGLAAHPGLSLIHI